MSAEIYAIVGEFETPEDVVTAARRAHEAGYRRLDAYSPYPVEGLAEALAFHRTWVPQLVLAGGVAGGVGGYLLQWWVSTVAYPLNVGGRPLHSWPLFIPVTFETTVLGAALAAVIGMLLLNGLPRPYHSVFNTPGFERASQDRFFLAIEAGDARFDRDATAAFLLRLGAVTVSHVEP